MLRVPLVKSHSCNKSTNLLPVLAMRGGRLEGKERKAREREQQRKTVRENEQANIRARMHAFKVDTLKP